MFSNISFSEILIVVGGGLCLYLVILVTVFGKKVAAVLGWPLRPIVHQTAAFSPEMAGDRSPDALPPLIDKPADHPAEQAGVFQDYEDLYYESTDDGAITLLKSAEHVVEQIQEVVDNIASHPANPEEVFTKIRAIVSQYSFFEDTEYYDAINSFVAVTVKRDCDLALTEEDLKALWLEEAA